MALAVQSMKTPVLLQTYRETLLRLGATRTDQALARQADQLEEEINRRIAWG